MCNDTGSPLQTCIHRHCTSAFPVSHCIAPVHIECHRFEFRTRSFGPSNDQSNAHGCLFAVMQAVFGCPPQHGNFSFLCLLQSCICSHLDRQHPNESTIRIGPMVHFQPPSPNNQWTRMAAMNTKPFSFCIQWGGCVSMEHVCSCRCFRKPGLKNV